MRSLARLLAVSMLLAALGCERVPDNKGGTPEAVVTMMPARVEAAAPPAAEAGPAPAAELQEPSAAAPGEAVFVLAAAAPDNDVCAAAQVQRHAAEGAVWYVFGPESSALRIDVAGLPQNSQPRTLAARVKVAVPVPDATIAALGAWHPSNLFALALSPQQTYFLWGYGQDAHSVTPVATGVWVHLAATYDGTNAMLYVNGERERTARLALTTAAGPLQLGGRHFQGVLADAAVWPRVLSADEIAALAAVSAQRSSVTENVEPAAGDVQPPGNERDNQPDDQPRDEQSSPAE